MDTQQDPILVVTRADRTPGPATPGMARQQAVATDGTWAGFVRTEAGMVSGWHHHGEYETVIYVLSGALKMEFGPNGSNTVEAGPGDFVYVPKGAVHRESNPYTVPADIIVVRAGSEEPHVADEYERPGGAAPPRLVRDLETGSRHPRESSATRSSFRVPMTP